MRTSKKQFPISAQVVKPKPTLKIAFGCKGKTILCSRGDGGKRPQLVEVQPDKKVVWVLTDWKNLGPATAVQILVDQGIPENPANCSGDSHFRPERLKGPLVWRQFRALEDANGT